MRTKARHVVYFYKAFTRNSTLTDKAIGLFTGGRYSHVEITMSNEDKVLRISDRVDVKLVSCPIYNDDNWDKIIIYADKSFDEDIVRLYTECIGKKYDLFGALFSAFGSIKWFCNNDREFCSEAVHNILYGEDGCNYSPNRLFNKLIKEKSYTAPCE